MHQPSEMYSKGFVSTALFLVAHGSDRNQLFSDLTWMGLAKYTFLPPR